MIFFSVFVSFDGDTLLPDCVRTISPGTMIVSIVSVAGPTIPGNKSAHMKAHLLGGVLVGYPHRASASSEATASQAVGAATSVDMLDTGGDIVALA